jgi:3-deoxy-7-phosphoheptulonate synthase
MKTFLIFTFFINTIGFNLEWSKSSWRNKPVQQIPKYFDNDKLIHVEGQLSKQAPLVFAGECDNLQESLAKICFRQGFLLMGGDCAELFNEFSITKIRDSYRLILQMGMILTYGSGLPTTKIGRMAGQFAKPRSDEFEIVNNRSVLTYRGDIINDINNREPDPNKMIDAYHQSTQTLNLLRAFSSGGYADVNRIHSWNLDFVEKTIEGSKYRLLANEVSQSLRFIKGLGIDINSNDFKQTNFYTAHECLLLNYEEALTRIDSRSEKFYDCSAHMVWLGERTRNLDGAHVEFMRGINNPIGIKLSEKIKESELVELINILNPSNVPGKIVLITRMGSQNLKIKLPSLIREVQKNGFNVVWCCDPMHANTIKTKTNIKTRSFDAIKDEVIAFFEIHKSLGSYPGGLHLELTGQDITECIGGEYDSIKENDLNKNYLSQCDPRLNSMQSLELAFLVSDLLSKFTV